jgi:hypothetical protein
LASGVRMKHLIHDLEIRAQGNRCAVNGTHPT